MENLKRLAEEYLEELYNRLYIDVEDSDHDKNVEELIYFLGRSYCSGENNASQTVRD